MAAVTALSFSALTQCSERKATTPLTRFLGSNSNAFRLRMNFTYHYFGVRSSNSAPKMIVQCMSSVIDAQKLEEWAQTQNPTSLVEFLSREEVEGILKDIAERAGGKEAFSYSRFFAVGLFRLLELVNATKPTILEKLCVALNIDKKSVDGDLDVYGNLLSKLLKEYVNRKKKKREGRAESQKAEAIAT